MVSLEEPGLKRPVPISGDLQVDRSDPCGELPLIRPVAVALPRVGPLVRFGAQVFGHLRLQHLVQDRLQQRCHSSVALEQVLDLFVVDCILKSGHR